MDMSKEELADNLLEVLRVNKTLSEKLTQSEKDRDDAVSQSMQFSEIMKKALNEITSLNELVSLMKQKCEISDSVISEFKSKLDHLMNNGNQGDGAGSEGRIQELTEQLLEKTKELETSNAVNIKLLKDNQSIRRDVEGMLQVLNGLEKQLNLYSGREEEVEEMVRQGNEKWNQAIAIQNECGTREKFYVTEIQRLTEEIRSLQSNASTQRRSGNHSVANESDVDTNFATAGSVVELATMEGTAGETSNGSMDDSNSCLEDSQVSSILIGYCGDAVPLKEAVQLLGFDLYSAEDVVNYILALAKADDKEHGQQITQCTYQRGLAKLLAFRYISISVLQRSISDYIIDSLFSILDAGDTGACSAHEVGCGILLFCEAPEAEKADIAWELLLNVPLSSDDDDDSDSENNGNEGSDRNDRRGANDGEETIELYSVIQALSALYKAHSCLNPEVAREQPNYKSVADGHAISEIYSYWGRYKRSLDGTGASTMRMSTKQRVRKSDFTRMFIVTLSKLQSHDHKVHARRKHMSIASDSGEDEEDEEDEYEDGEGYDSDSGANTASSQESEDHAEAAAVAAQLDDSLRVETCNDDGSEFDEDEDADMYLNDELFPPSAVVLELRAARAILGLEQYAAEDMLETLGLKCHAGYLTETRWIEWLWYVIDESSTSEQDTVMARALGSKVFAAFDVNGDGEVEFSRIAAGLAFMCGASPLEDRLMVSFVVVDDDSDGYISAQQFQSIVQSVLTLVATCSKLATKKIVSVGATLSELAVAAASEGLAALSLADDEEEISFEMLSELSEDYVKLAAIF